MNLRDRCIENSLATNSKRTFNLVVLLVENETSTKQENIVNGGHWKKCPANK